MSGASQHISYAEYYFSFLKNLNAESKLDLISQLSLSLKSDRKEDYTLQSVFGAYKSDETAEEIIDSIRSSRVSNRNIEEL